LVCGTVVIPVPADSFKLELLHVFHHTPNSSEGAEPAGPVHVFPDGSVIGTTSRGGNYGGGTVFTVTAKGELKVLHQFSGRDGLYPDGCLVPGKDGGFYGTLHGSHPSVFRIGVDGSFATVYRFDQPAGDTPRVVSIKGTDGNVYSVSDRFDSGFRLLYSGERASTEPDKYLGLLTAAPGSRIFVTKFNNLGNAIVYSTYFGGSGLDVGAKIAVDTKGNAYVAGTTQSTDFPTVKPMQDVNHGFDAFISKIADR